MSTPMSTPRKMLEQIATPAKKGLSYLTRMKWETTGGFSTPAKKGLRLVDKFKAEKERLQEENDRLRTANAELQAKLSASQRGPGQQE